MKILFNDRVSGLAGGGLHWCLSALCGLIAATALTGTAQAQNSPGSAVQNGLLTHQGQSYQVVDAASYLSTGDSGNTIAPVACSSCNSRGTSCGGRCGGGRGGLGLGGALGLGLFDGRGWNLSDDGCNYGLEDACAVCQPYWYGSIEGLYMELDGGDDLDLADFFKGGFGQEWGSRFTFGNIRDCVRGCEITFTGRMEWESSASRTDPTFSLGSLITPVPPLTAADISAFNNAGFQREQYIAEYWSLELNRTVVAGDMAKLLYGFRYIDYSEDFRFFSQNATESGLIRSEVENSMYGFQVGWDLLYPVCRRGYTDFRSRFAGFLNSADSNFRLINAGTENVLNFDDIFELAGVIELGSGFRYRRGNWWFRAGGEFWYFYNVAAAPGNFQRQIDAGTGSSNRGGTEFYMVGMSFGTQFQY